MPLFSATAIIGALLAFLHIAGYVLEDNGIPWPASPAMAQQHNEAAPDAQPGEGESGAAAPASADSDSATRLQDGDGGSDGTDDQADAPADDAMGAADDPGQENGPATDEAATDGGDRAGQSGALEAAGQMEPGISPAERQLLQTLRERRREIDRRERAGFEQERLLKALEARIDDKMAALRNVEDNIAAQDARARQEAQEKRQRLVTMYETMKPKDAARIFNRLELPILTELAGVMQARKMSAILAAMDAAAAERLTIALVGLTPDAEDPAVTDGLALPKIEGTPQP